MTLLHDKHSEDDVIPMCMMKEPLCEFCLVQFKILQFLNKLVCGLTSYSVKEATNTFTDRMIESGLQEKVKYWSVQLLRSMSCASRTSKEEERKGNKVVLDVDKIFELFILYTAGICMSLCVFIVELHFNSRAICVHK